MSLTKYCGSYLEIEKGHTYNKVNCSIVYRVFSLKSAAADVPEYEKKTHESHAMQNLNKKHSSATNSSFFTEMSILCKYSVIIIVKIFIVL